jgi:hypothetical protein
MRPARLVTALLLLAAISSGCPWDVDPCFLLQRGDACTLCEHLDDECIKKEQPHFCDACGECLAPGEPGLGSRTQCTPEQPQRKRPGRWTLEIGRSMRFGTPTRSSAAATSRVVQRDFEP